MKFLLKLILSALAVLVVAQILPGVQVEDYFKAIIVAIVLAILNAIVRPVLVFLTLPATIVTLGLFLLVINAAIILLADYFIDGFRVNGWIWALIFSVLLSIFQSILHSILKKDKS
ncbi:phage holin family protein [Aquimarina sp. D1M17]|uniref:phage holin family protein n=1 Tax=Aquimarina acroporae TaxID=2937283 RepID=UPI0020BF769E|nr:phage holin family protein [Aquimarina acroporae]MCK8522393.1 phage holin family protein [Aquimarina acroporae]